MANYNELIIKLNSFLRRNGVAEINEDLHEIKDILEHSLENIYRLLGSRKKRETLTRSIITITEKYYANIVPYTNEIIKKLEGEMPGEDDYPDIYNEALEKYNDFVSVFIATKEVSPHVLKMIALKLIVLADKFKNSIIRYISVHNPDYPVLVLHGINSTLIALIGGINLKYDTVQLEKLAVSALLHDIGMFLLPEELLNKSGKLTDDEFTSIKNHTALAYKLLSKLNFDKDVLDGIVQHHEQFDGRGYPRKLKGSEINQFALIISIADSFDAQISKRTYREAKSSYNAMKEVISNANNKFDSHILKAFLMSLSIYPPGTLVQLNDYSIGLVDSINNDASLRPVLRIIIDKDGNKIKDRVLLDLKNHQSLYIALVLNKDDYKRNNK
ncbi:MAG: hypothetical protein A2015_00340 [Spirochaetes bacterium GWF1_31_7]|nr:MAG: hypothetical protein A2Y30_04170 [Spirochaetes bacterium GWE1_32_154]OHD51036.1 MAG: hypothetical protein A2015_00340 [Spirochaetes bacterium GWF1_31_7]OHD51784.1 MAG: hypothetical protein A2Y29_09120 [Spirochaetes bacterium GWE2_31_10]OHD79491.1 MAG: hypothetical protein A2355_00675 [Spirochaetes bacterium RIFOXYB1_FULL_32_8]HBD94354.1 hypothetical protein [Spirochaetia bacterium]